MRKRWLPELMAQYKYGETKQPFYKSNPYRLDNVKILAKYINPNVEVVALSDEIIYGQMGLVVIFKCSCGEIFKRRINDVDKEDLNLACKKCAHMIRRRNLSLNKLESKLSLIEESGFKLLSPSDYIEDADRILVENKEGYRGYIKYANLRIGHGKGMMWFSPKHNKDNIIYNANVFCKNNGYGTKVIGFSQKQNDRKTKVQCQCECGEIFDTTINSLTFYHHTRCRKCTTKISKWCKKVEDVFKSNNIGYSKEVCFDDCKDKSYLRFDYQLDINDGLIEVDGEQHFHVNRFGMGMSEEEKIEHFKMIQKHDRIKENYCKENGIKFLRISYKEILNNSFKEKILEFVA